MARGKQNMSQWTLRKFAEWWFEHREGKPIGDHHRSVYRNTIKRLADCLGHEPICREITQTTINRFTKWSREQGYKEPTTITRCEQLRSLARRWDPSRFPIDWTPPKGILFANSDIPESLEHLVETRFIPERPQLASPRSIALYGKTLSVFGQFLERPVGLADLTDQTLGQFVRWMILPKAQGGRGIKNSTANMYLKRLIAVWNWCAKKRLVAEFPTIGKLPEPERLSVSWTEEEIAAIMTAAKKMRTKIGKVPAAAFWRAFHLIIWDGGERTGAMLALRWEWVDWRRRLLTVQAEARKGGCKMQIYHLKSETMAALRAIREPRRELIFPLPFSVSTFYDRYKVLIEKAGLTYVSRQTTPQQMRRSFASHLESRGGNATKALRHTDRRLTEKSYLDPRITDTENPNDKLFGIDVV